MMYLEIDAPGSKERAGYIFGNCSEIELLIHIIDSVRQNLTPNKVKLSQKNQT